MTFINIRCCQCSELFGMTPETYKTAKARGEEFTFYCPHGHGQVLTKGETEAEKLRREVNRLKQNAAYLEDARRRATDEASLERRRAAAARGQVTKLKKRAAAGVCPCCNRTFHDLARHMAGQHPEFLAQPQEAERVH